MPVSAAQQNRRTRSAWLGLCVAVAMAVGVDPGSASPLGVTPTFIVITPTRPTELLTLSNQGEAVVRLQLSAFAWQQRADGEMVLGETEDVVFFPQLVAVKPGETQRIRIALSSPPAEAEKSYRLIIQELPDAPSPQEPSHIGLLTRLSLPVFQQPRTVQPSASLEPAAAQDGTLAFSLRNAGTRHFMTRRVVATGLDENGRSVFSAETSGWYVLAGGRRDYQLALAPADCRAARRVRVVAEVDDKPLTAEIPLTAGACAGRSGGATRFLGAPVHFAENR